MITCDGDGENICPRNIAYTENGNDDIWIDLPTGLAVAVNEEYLAAEEAIANGNLKGSSSRQVWITENGVVIEKYSVTTVWDGPNTVNGTVDVYVTKLDD